MYDTQVHILTLKTIFEVIVVIFTSVVNSLGISGHYPGFLW